MDMQPNPCCRAAAEKLGLPPSMDILCHNCSDYRAHLHTKYSEEDERYHPPDGFKHMTYEQITGKKGR